MLPTTQRVRRREEFQAALRGTRAGGPLLAVHVAPEPAIRRAASDSDTSSREAADMLLDVPVKVGFVVSKAVGGAVVRNTVKRRLRHLMAARISRLVPGSLAVVRANPAAAGASSAALGAALDRALDRIGRGSAVTS